METHHFVPHFRLGRKKLHYAWFVCFGCSILFFSVCGMACNVFSVYSPFIIKQGYSNSQVALINTSRSLAQLLAVLICGQYYHKLTLRFGMLLAGLLSATAYIVYGLANSLPVYLLGGMLVGIAYGLGTMVPIAMILDRWFHKDRTLAVSLVTSSSGLAALGVPSIVTSLIQTKGISYAFIAEGICMAGLAFIAFLIVRNYPEDKRLHALGDDDQPKKTKEPKSQGVSDVVIDSKPRLSKPFAILSYIMMFISMSFNSIGWANLSLLATTEGYAPEIVALSISSAGLMLMIGKFIFGFLSVRLTLRQTSLIFSITLILGTIMLLNIRFSPVILMLGYGLYGGSLSMVAIGQVSWVEDWFPHSEYEKQCRRFQTALTLGCICHGMVPGILADIFGGSYRPYYTYTLVCTILVSLTIQLLYKKAGKR